jgi:two-component system CheB/CheR fusion protein
MVGASAMCLFNEEDKRRGAADHEFDVARTAGRGEDDRWHVRKDGTLFWGSGVTVALHDEGGNHVGFAKLVRNRTDVKTQTEVLEKRVESFTKKEEHHRRFMALLAHELRNPLAPMHHALGLIREVRHPDELTIQALGIIDRQMAVLARLVDDLVDNVRVSSGKLKLDTRLLDLTNVVRAAADSCRAQAQARDQAFDVVLMSGAVMVHADGERLQQVFVNLLNNAIKYTPREGRIFLSMTTEGNDAVVRVEDNGIGMGPDLVPKVFDLFTQEDASASASAGGLGLGLALVRDLVQMHRGTVQARSDGRGKGSIFTVRLPMQAPGPP